MINTTSQKFSFAEKDFEIDVPSNDFLGHILSRGRLWEEHFLIYLNNHIIQKNLQETFLFFDIGANVGYHSIIINKLFPKITTCAVEPHPEVIEILLRNRTKNEGSFLVIPNAVGETPGPGNISLAGDTDTGDFHIAENGVNVNIITINSIAEKFGTPDFIKLDIQGFELDALIGGAEIIKKNKTAFFIEFCPLLLKTRGCGKIQFIKEIENVGYSYFVFRAHPFFCFEWISADILMRLYHQYNERNYKGYLELLIQPNHFS